MTNLTYLPVKGNANPVEDFNKFIDILRGKAVKEKRKRELVPEDTTKWLKKIPPHDVKELHTGFMQLVSMQAPAMMTVTSDSTSFPLEEARASSAYQFLMKCFLNNEDRNNTELIENGSVRVMNRNDVHCSHYKFSVLECGHIKQPEKYRIYKIVMNHDFAERAVEVEAFRALQMANDSVRILFPLLNKSVPLCMCYMFNLLECTPNIARLNNDHQMKKVVMWSVGYARHFTKRGHYDPRTRHYIEDAVAGPSKEDFWIYLVKELLE